METYVILGLVLVVGIMLLRLVYLQEHKHSEEKFEVRANSFVETAGKIAQLEALTDDSTEVIALTTEKLLSLLVKDNPTDTQRHIAHSVATVHYYKYK